MSSDYVTSNDDGQPVNVIMSGEFVGRELQRSILSGKENLIKVMSGQDG